MVELAAWMRRSGVTTLAVVLPHAQGRLPEALKRGLASLDEQAVAALQLAPPGIHVAAPQSVWEAAQGEPHVAVRQWLGL